MRTDHIPSTDFGRRKRGSTTLLDPQSDGILECKAGSLAPPYQVVKRKYQGGEEIVDVLLTL